MDQKVLNRLETFHQDQYDAFWGIELDWDFEVVKHFAEISTNAIHPAAFNVELLDSYGLIGGGQTATMESHTLPTYMQHCATLCHDTFSYIERSMTIVAQKCDTLAATYGPLTGHDGLARVLKTEIAVTHVNDVCTHTTTLGYRVFDEIETVFQRWNTFQRFVENFRHMLASELDATPKKRQQHSQLLTELQEASRMENHLRRGLLKWSRKIQDGDIITKAIQDGIDDYSIDQVKMAFASRERELTEKAAELQLLISRLEQEQTENRKRKHCSPTELVKPGDTLLHVDIQMREKLGAFKFETTLINERRSKYAATVGYLAMIHAMWYGLDPSEQAERLKEQRLLDSLEEECKNARRKYEEAKLHHDLWRSHYNAEAEDYTDTENKLLFNRTELRQISDRLTQLESYLKYFLDEVTSIRILNMQQADLEQQMKSLSFDDPDMHKRDSEIFRFQTYVNALWDACPKVSSRLGNLKHQISIDGEVGRKLLGLLRIFDANSQARCGLMDAEAQKFCQRHIEICIELAITFSVIRDFVKFYRDMCREVTNRALHESVLMKYDYPTLNNIQVLPSSNDTKPSRRMATREVSHDDASSPLALGRRAGRVLEEIDDGTRGHDVCDPELAHDQYRHHSMAMISKVSVSVKTVTANKYARAKEMPTAQRRSIIEAICSSAIGLEVRFVSTQQGASALGRQPRSAKGIRGSVLKMMKGSREADNEEPVLTTTAIQSLAPRSSTISVSPASRMLGGGVELVATREAARLRKSR